jgi:hypothetical protein
MIYFAYDIAMDERELKRPGLAPCAIVAGTGWLANRKLVFSGEGGRMPVAMPSYGDKVYGVLFFITDPGEIARIAALRSPLPRRVTRVRTLPSNRIVFAVTFEPSPDKAVFEGPADPGYLNSMVETARRYEFPDSYVTHLLSLPSPDDSTNLPDGGDPPR